MINVLVDIDGTMMDSPHLVDRRSSAVMFKNIFNIKAHEEMIDNSGRPEKYIIKTVLKKFDIIVSEIPDAAYQTWANAERIELKTNPASIKPGIVNLLDSLKNNPKIKLLLLTGNSKYRAEVKLNSVGLDRYFRDLKTGKLVGIFGEEGDTREELLLKFLNTKKTGDKFIILDDSLLGGEMAKKNNVPIILVGTGKFSQEKLKPYTKYVFQDLGENRWKEALNIIIDY